jgi:hypothetical protein
MKKMAGFIKVGDIVVIRKGKEEEVTDVRRHGFPRNSSGRSFMLTVQRGPFHTMFEETDMVEVK